MELWESGGMTLEPKSAGGENRSGMAWIRPGILFRPGSRMSLMGEFGLITLGLP